MRLKKKLHKSAAYSWLRSGTSNAKTFAQKNKSSPFNRSNNSYKNCEQARTLQNFISSGSEAIERLDVLGLYWGYQWAVLGLSMGYQWAINGLSMDICAQKP